MCRLPDLCVCFDASHTTYPKKFHFLRYLLTPEIPEDEVPGEAVGRRVRQQEALPLLDSSRQRDDDTAREVKA